MSNVQINQVLVVPLFGARIKAPFSIEVAPSDFVEHLTAYIFPKPIPLNTGVRLPENNDPVSIPIPVPRTTIKLLPWGPKGDAEKGNSVFADASVLPSEFDRFDNLGMFAVRAGPDTPGGFQTITTLFSKKCALALLVIEFDQVYPTAATCLLGGTNPYESHLVEAVLDAMRLLSGHEPHPYKGYHIAGGKLLDTVIKWPLVEMQGSPLEVDLLSRSDMERVFLRAWHVRKGARQNSSFKIVALAMEYYYLSSTITETRTIFLYLMIAFEALFKRKDEESASAASARFAKFVASSKAQFNEIRRFMWNTKETPGCCQIRNEIVHGGVAPLELGTYWKLRDFLRSAIEQLLRLVISGAIDKASYYESVCRIVDERFRSLPNS